MGEDRSRCCVCDRPSEGAGGTLGGRAFCETHYARVAREGPAAVKPVIGAVAISIIFAGLVAALTSLAPPRLSLPVLVLVGLVMALVPGVVWLAAFYLQDRLEPEPKHTVVGVFLLGMLLAAAVGQPVIRDLVRVQDWMYEDLGVAILGSILIVGMVQEALKYAAIRYTVFHSLEFDERIDGIVYGAAAGLGYATMLNLLYVIDHGGVDLGVGAVQVAITALAHASFSGIVGYFLGRAKFERMGPLWLPIGLILAAVLNGSVSLLLRRVAALGGFSFSPWPSLVAAAIVAGVTFAIVFTLMRRLNAATLAARPTS